MPLTAAFFNYVMPLQIGARDVAFPYLNSLSFWLTAAGAGLVMVSLFVGEFSTAGWLNYVPVANLENSPGVGPDYYLWALQIAGVGTPRVPIDSARRPRGGDREIDAHGMYVMPGLVDIQLNGAFGVDFSDPGGDLATLFLTSQGETFSISIEGVAGPESANNAGAQTSFIPLLTLGIPANPVMALMVGAMIIQGTVPGPEASPDARRVLRERRVGIECCPWSIDLMAFAPWFLNESA